MTAERVVGSNAPGLTANGKLGFSMTATKAITIYFCAAVLSTSVAHAARDPVIVEPYHSRGLPDEPGPRGFLFAAAMAVRAHDRGTALEALERAKTRLLDRSVPLGAAGVPENTRMLDTITQARLAIEVGDWASARVLVDSTLHFRNR